MLCVVTGAAGFIGSNLVDRLIGLGHEVIGLDNFGTGRRRFLEKVATNKNFRLYQVDLFKSEDLSTYFAGVDVVFHLSANADVRFGVDRTRVDLEQNTMVTYNVIESMKRVGASNIIFSSTGSVYGEAKDIPTSETSQFPIQTSLYGASKLACEGMICAFNEAFDFNSWIFRFVSILGPRYTHGHVFDFVEQLRSDASNLRILGDGSQRKSYLHIDDCIDALIMAANGKLDCGIYNLGTDDCCNVEQSATWICEQMRVNPRFNYSGGKRGWVGDNPYILLDTAKIRNFGWNPKYTIEESVKGTVDFLRSNEWVFSR
ncbi:NAD-dependent epimerase/dehydratase family protein [Planktomarina temperata]|nr:NAD-dependent epimerase/dehydratase family protein [Planktomarina temperata]MDC1094164.1 NAD-dependent epimerase/dehydratase family protein [Planktomarina temperata]